jgi:hypothetical protein
MDQVEVVGDGVSNIWSSIVDNRLAVPARDGFRYSPNAIETIRGVDGKDLTNV